MGARHGRRSWRVSIALVATLSLVLAACGGGDDETDTDTESDAGTDTDGDGADADAGGEDVPDTIVIDYISDHQEVVFDPHVRSAPADRLLMRPVYDTLLTFTSDNLEAPEPWLAESFDVSEDATQFTFNLREDVNFSDGTPLTAVDVAWSINRLRNIDSPTTFLTDGITDVRAEGDFTVVIETDIPRPDIPSIVSSPSLGVVNSAVLEDLGAVGGEGANAEPPEVADYFTANSAGSGPYMIETYDIQQEVVIVKNPEWWGTEPLYERIIFRPADVGVQLLNVQSGESDIALNLSGEELQQLDRDQFIIQEETGTNVWALTLNLQLLEVDDQDAFIDAVRLAIDWDSLAELGGPGASRNCGFVHLQLLGGIQPGDERCVERDVEAATDFLEQSGYDGEDLTFIINPEHNRDGVQSTQLGSRLQQQFAEIGLNVELNEAAPTAHNEMRDSGVDTHFYITPTSLRWPDPSADASYWSPGGGAGLIGETYRCCWMASDDDRFHEPIEGTERAEELAAIALSAPTDEERLEALLEMQEIANEQAPFWPMIQGSVAVVAQPNIPDPEHIHPVWLFEIPTFAGAGPA